jgi:hypothetical protein
MSGAEARNRLDDLTCTTGDTADNRHAPQVRSGLAIFRVEER